MDAADASTSITIGSSDETVATATPRPSAASSSTSRRLAVAPSSSLSRIVARSAWLDAEPAPAAHALRGATQPDGSIQYKDAGDASNREQP